VTSREEIVEGTPSDQREDAPPPPKVVLDTNTLVANAYAERSASRRIVEACLCGDLVAVLSPALRREYERILAVAVRVHGHDGALQQFLQQALVVEPAETPRVVPDDPEDDKLLAVTIAAGADVIVSSDRHLLGLDPYGSVRIVRPTAFLRLWLPENPKAP
jgi:putative PIN family toxin of toxin-antitoxin system